jgi:nitrogenase subunit NifH
MSAPNSNLKKAEERMNNIKAKREINYQILHDYATSNIEGSFLTLNNWLTNELACLREMLEVIYSFAMNDVAMSLLDDLKEEMEEVSKTRDERIAGVLNNSASATDVTRMISEVSRRMEDLVSLVVRLTEIHRKLDNAWGVISRPTNATP